MPCGSHARAHLPRRYGLPLALLGHVVFFVAIVGLAASANEWDLPLPLSLLLLISLAALHGLVLSSCFVLVGNAGTEKTAYAGLANQIGSLTGAALQSIVIHGGFLPGY